MKKREYFERRLCRILNEAGYTFDEACDLSTTKLLEIKGITIPNVRVILHYKKNRGRRCTKCKSD